MKLIRSVRQFQTFTIMKKNRKVFVAGHNGMVGRAIISILKRKYKKDIIITKKKSELNLLNQKKVYEFFKKEKLSQVYIAAGKVGGINANKNYPADFIYENLMITCNLIQASFQTRVKKILFIGSNAIYPKKTDQPIKESDLLSGYLEPTNEPYAISKIAGIKLCESYNRQFSSKFKVDYRSIMSCNLYGPNDNYNLQNSHVVPALIRRFYEARKNKKKYIKLWGTGKAKRELLYVDDMAEACVFLMNLSKNKYLKNILPMQSHLNVGSGYDISIEDLAKKISKVIGYKGGIKFDKNKPDGAPRKLMNSSKINQLGWKSKTSLNKGLKKTYKDFLINKKK